MLAFSTCWNSHRHSEGEPLVDEILSMGFDTIEISHGLKISLLPGIQKAIAAGRVKVSGVHNFCPSPVELMIDAPDAYEFTSHRSRDRERALQLTLRTIDFAAEVNARYVVIHLGSVPMKHMSEGLAGMLKEGRQNDRGYVKQKIKFVKIRESLSRLYFGRAKQALETMLAHATEKKVPLGIESRSHYEQVPDEREMTELMEQTAGPFLGYWHDFGHVQRKANLGLLNHFEWLERMRPFLIGCHFHDVIWPDRDHRVPFQGDVDFDRLLPLVRPDLPVVWEMGPRRKKADIMKALPEWKERYAAWV